MTNPKPAPPAEAEGDAAETSPFYIQATMPADDEGPRVLKHGKTIRALVVVDVLASTPASVRRFDSPFVGRVRQRAALETALGNAVRDRTCHLLTVRGSGYRFSAG